MALDKYWSGKLEAGLCLLNFSRHVPSRTRKAHEAHDDDESEDRRNLSADRRNKLYIEPFFSPTNTFVLHHTSAYLTSTGKPNCA
jgi:hypothetical protein